MLGANWLPKVWGIIFAVSLVIYTTPSAIDWLPESIRPIVKGVCGIIVLTAGTGLAVTVKQKNVTGGTQQQTTDGSKARDGTQTLVDETVKSTMASGKPVTEEQRFAVSR